MPKMLKTPKAPFRLTDLDFLEAMCRNFHEGAQKENRIENGWKIMSWDEGRESEYIAKVLRHLQNFTRACTPEDKCKAAAAIGCNANILWHHSREAKNNGQKKD